MLDIGKSAVRLSLFSFWSAPPYFSLFFCNANDEKKSDLELMTIFGLTMLPDGLNPPVGIVRYGSLTSKASDCDGCCKEADVIEPFSLVNF
jgi:hypothetical protein